METKTTHTPGPYRVEPTNHGERGEQHPHEIIGPKGQKLGRSYGSNFSSGANARLWAAAPDLLEALRDLVDDFDRSVWTKEPMLVKARAAIAKAEGGAA